MRDAFIAGFKTGLQQWKIAAIVYVLQLCLALALGMQVFHVLEASIGKSLEISKLIYGYDHTVLTDFLKVHGASITPLIGQLRWLILVYLLFAVFIDGGLLYGVATSQPVQGHTFWKGGATYFFPFLKIGLLLLLPLLLWTLVVWMPFGLCLEASLLFFPSEAYTVWLAVGLLAVYGVGLAILFVWSVLSRLAVIQTGVGIGAGLRQGWRLFKGNKKRLLGLLGLFLLLKSAFLVVYFALEAATGMQSPLLIGVFFVVQQALVFFRIQIRQMVYAGLAKQVYPNTEF